MKSEVGQMRGVSYDAARQHNRTNLDVAELNKTDLVQPKHTRFQSTDKQV